MAALAPLEADRAATAEVLTRENGKIRMESFIDSIVFAHRFELAAALADEVDDVARLPGAAVPDRGLLPAARRGDDHRPVQLAAGDPRRLAAPGAAGRQHRRRQAAARPRRWPPCGPSGSSRSSLPPGVLNVVTGADAEIGAALIQDDRVKKVCFTGSPGAASGSWRMAAELADPRGARARRQRPGARARRRRPRRRGDAAAVRRHLRLHRPDLHGGQAPLRAPLALRRGRRRAVRRCSPRPGSATGSTRA